MSIDEKTAPTRCYACGYSTKKWEQFHGEGGLPEWRHVPRPGTKPFALIGQAKFMDGRETGIYMCPSCGAIKANVQEELKS